MNGVAAPVEYNTEVHTTRKMSAGLRNNPDMVSDSNFISPVPDHISSIHDNPFYKSFGVRHPRALTSREPSLPVRAKHSDTESTLQFREELGEYKPGSGFVHKLMGKFASLSTREEPTPSYLHIKHAGSVENILRNDQHTAETEDNHTEETRIGGRERGRESFRSQKHRARSVDSVNNSHRKPHLQVSLRHVDRKWERPPSPTKPTRDSHIEAPDVTLAPENIILIENPPPQPSATDAEVDSDATDDRSQAHATYFKDEAAVDELPKPNTVLTVRNIFESAAQAEAEHVSRRDKPLSPTRDVSSWGDFDRKDSPISPTDPAARGQAFTPREVRPHVSQSSPRVVDAARNFEFPRTAEFVRNGDRQSSSSMDVNDTGSMDTSIPAEIPLPLTNTTSSSFSSSSSSSSTVSSLALSSNSGITAELHSDDRTLVSTESSRPIPAGRSTAAVKAVPASRPVVPARSSKTISDASTTATSAATSVPPSFTPSVKKTSPVMPVAPFKKQTESEDENRYLVFTSKKDTSKPSKPRRVKDYGEMVVDTASHTKRDETERKQVETDVQKVNKVNVLHKKGRAPPVPLDKVDGSDGNLVQTLKVVNSRQDSWSSPRIEDTMAPELPAEKIPFHLVSNVERERGKPTTVSQSEGKEKQDIPVSMETQEMTEPIKGIPRIIAQRMKQNSEAIHTGPPGELFGVRLGKTRHEDDGKDDGSEIPCKRLTPVQSLGKQDKAASVPSEIENQIASVRKRMEAGSQNKSGGVSQIFDSSQLQKKRREKQAARTAPQVGVPRLDLSSLTSEDSGNPGSDGGYRVTPREIKPCSIEFIGANISLGRSLLDKNRTIKVSCWAERK